MEACSNWRCNYCGHVGLENGYDGFFYCCQCSTMADDVIDTAVAEEDIAAGGIYMPSHRRKHAHVMEVTPIHQHDPLYDSQPELFKAVGLGDLLPQQIDDGRVKALSFEDYCNGVRMRYVLGLQIMLQLHCETLVDEFNMTPLICDHVEKTWLRFLTATNVFGRDWAQTVIAESETQQSAVLSEDSVYKQHGKHKGEPQNKYGERAVIIWNKYLRKTIPLHCTLAISFLACHLAREAVLPTDITKWAIERKLPYLSAFVDIDKLMGPPGKACPITSKQMFNPSRHALPQEIESLAATIADSIGLDLPPVNFFEIADRYLRQLKLPHDVILPKAILVYEWSMPPDLWLSTKESKVPTRLCVLSILIVAIRMLYNINGFGCWERSLCDNTATSLKSKGKFAVDSDFNEEDAAKLLRHLHSLYTGLRQEYEHTKDLKTYLKYCEDFVFAGLDLSFENYEEKRTMEQLWNYYQNCYRDEKNPSETEVPSNSSKIPWRIAKKTQKCLNNKYESTDNDDGCIERMNSSNREQDIEALKILKLDMEEKKFHYIPPRMNVKRSFDYIHYVRKKDNGNLTYVAHADYYILLRACAQVAQVDVRVMHMAVLNFEKRLIWIEDMIEKTLRVRPKKIRCEHC